MSFTSISAAESAAGKPVTNTLVAKIRDNFDNLDERVSDIENGTNISYPPIILRVNGPYSNTSSADRVGILKTTANFNLRITGIRLLVDKAGISGATSVDVLRKTGNGSFTSVLTAQPSVSFSAGSDAVSTNAVLNESNINILAGDLIRLDLTGVQTGGINLMVRIDYEKV